MPTNKVYVWRLTYSYTGWRWEVAPAEARRPGNPVFSVPTAFILDYGTAPTHADAVAFGLNALRSYV